MLIRSQDKRILINMNNVSSIEVGDDRLRLFADNGDAIYDIGEYSTEAKVIKVLDMIQDAYMEYKSGEIVGNGLAGSAYTGSYDTKESVAHGIAVLKGYGNEIRKSILFQMPEDSEVEV